MTTMHGSMDNMHMGQMMRGSEMMLNMMGMSPNVLRLQPNQILGHAAELGLTEGQTLQLKLIAAEQQDAHSPKHMAAMVVRTNEIDRLLGDAEVTDADIRGWVEGVGGVLLRPAWPHDP